MRPDAPLAPLLTGDSEVGSSTSTNHNTLDNIASEDVGTVEDPGVPIANAYFAAHSSSVDNNNGTPSRALMKRTKD